MKNRKLSLLFVAVLCICVTGCTEDSNGVANTSDDTEEKLTEENQEASVNEMMKDEEKGSGTTEMPTESGNIIDNGSNYGISNLIKHAASDDIYTITFLDSLNDMPEDAWDISEYDDRSVMAWLVEAENTDEEYYDLYIAGEGGVDAPSYGLRMFSELPNLISVNFNNNFYTGNATTLYMYFQGCSSLQSIDLNSWDVSNVENISYLFDDCMSLTEIKINEWDVSNVIYMVYTFAGCSSLQNINLKDWNVSSVINLGGMFEFCTSLASVDLSDWMLSTDNEEFDCQGMFYNCTSLQDVKVGNIDMEDESVWGMFTERY
ncbi:MAG: DUF285 domain-containing protein [Clostridiales bacterium]|nr:DUF285 domain-containing protein [Clostridiales bacterium]